MRQRLVVPLLGLLVMLSLLVAPFTSAAAAPFAPPIDFDSVRPLPAEWRPAVSLALSRDASPALAAQALIVTAFEVQGDWAHIVLTPRYIVDGHWEVAFSWDEIVEVLARRSNGRYDASVMDSPAAARLKADVPPAFMNVAPVASVAGLDAAPAPLMPWTSGQVWYKTYGWHSDGYSQLPDNAFDMAPNGGSSNPGRDYAVLAPTSGRLTRICDDTSDQGVLRLETEHGVFGFLHIRVSSIPSDVVNQDVPRGRNLGHLYNPGGRFDSKCGNGTGVHLHFDVPRRDLVMDGLSVDSVATAANKQGFGSSNQRTDTNNAGDTDGSAFAYGESRNGTVNPARDTDEFTFYGSANDDVEIRLDKNNSNLDPLVVLRGPDGGYIDQDDDSGDGNNSLLNRRLSNTGWHRIIAQGFGSSTGGYTVRVNRRAGCSVDCQGDPRWIAFGQALNGVVDNNRDADTYFFNGTAGRTVKISMNGASGLDSFVELYTSGGSRVNYNDDSGGGRNALLVQQLPANDTYRILARSFDGGSAGAYELRLESLTGNGAGNLARGKNVYVDSVEASGYEGWRATDGNTGTRWSSRFSDPQLIYVDLGRETTFNQVVLRWETAYGKRFGIFYWTGSDWRNVYWTDSGRGGVNTIPFNPVRARYVAMWGVERGTGWGYSLWEFEVYDTNTTTSPLVPPDDPQKVDTVTGVMPLSPVEPGKEVLSLAEGDASQEETPLAAGENALPLQGGVGATQTVSAIILEPSTLGRGEDDPNVVRFEGEAASNVAGQAVPIVAYRWRSDRQGELGAQAAFTLPRSALLPGRHVIFFKAQNEQGAWSPEVSVTLDVELPHRLMLPMLAR